MKISENKVKYLCEKIFRSLKEKNLVVIKKGEERDVVDKMQKAFLDNLQQEIEIEKQVKQLMSQFQADFQSGKLNYSKMFNLAKKELAKKKGFIL